MFENDTICGVATGLGKSAIGMIRVSGPSAISICDGIFVGKKKLSEMGTFTAAYGKVVDGDKAIDEAIMLVMKAPHTYTTEDTVEIDLHGGSYVVRRVMQLLIERGVRPAEPGEFTKRAFLGGRIDMVEAEAVMDVINAETERSLDTSVKQLSGKLSKEIRELREIILHNTAYIESALDDPENYSLDGFSEELSKELAEVKQRIERLLSTADEGRIIREGISTAIVGRPNVGKSSLLNQLLGEERAIVTEIEGTTRDTLEEYVDIGGVLLKLIDTAGIRNTEDVVERIGVDKAREVIETADLVLLLVDGATGLEQEDRDIINNLGGKRVIALINKSDISTDAENEARAQEIRSLLAGIGIEDITIVMTSAKTGQGLDELKSQIRDMFYSDKIDYNNQIYITRARHRAGLITALEGLERVQDSIDQNMGEDFLTIDLMAAYAALGEIIGETLEDDLADKIFSDFCMGK
ncbi:MAG: tRNA uridine-5-carboxymethylaminomethyl(34) synthesis GTPase MnmE [Eubacterium sp.]|nr:tRNA uridine-5-carboxymethylaminomethyl(34) synthesis GTPase MnmE [Eubacterium sp.]